MYARNPIHHIESRVKSLDSIVSKLKKKNEPLTIESAMKNVNDIAGVRVVCNYIDDVYRVAVAPAYAWRGARWRLGAVS